MKPSYRIQASIPYNGVLLYDMHNAVPGDTPPFQLLVMEEAQVLMDDLWTAGLRPRDIGTAGHLAATQEHLKHVSGLLDRVLPLALRKP